MLKSKVFPIEKIYVPTKRRQTLDVEKVRRIAESMLQKGQDTPVMVREDGERLVLVRTARPPALKGGSAIMLSPALRRVAAMVAGSGG